MINLEIEKLCYEKNDDPSDLFQFCLENKLYKEDATDENFISRMKKVYEEDIKFEGVSVIITYHQENPIGLCLLEHRLGKDCDIFCHQAGMTHLDKKERKNPWKSKYDFNILHLGFISFYVKEEYRNKGVAQELLYEMEKLQLDRIQYVEFPKNVSNTMSNNFLTVTAREKAKDLLSKSTVFNITHGDITDGCFKNDISHLTYEIVFEDKTDKRLGDLIPNFCEQFQKKESFKARI